MLAKVRVRYPAPLFFVLFENSDVSVCMGNYCDILMWTCSAAAPPSAVQIWVFLDVSDERMGLKWLVLSRTATHAKLL